MTEKKHFNTVDGETLMNKPLEPINFVVDTLLSQGLHLLAGASKVGKSWLALWLSVMIAKGDAVWGMSVKKGTTLYLCLEDSTIRIQNRLIEITEDAPPNVHFTTEAFTIGHGLEEQIETFVAEHPDIVLIIIDTLQMIRNTTYDNTYANDYRDLTMLKKLADKHRIAILLIHHLRKEDDRDTFNRISGTTGVQGAVDTSFTLVEETRGSGKALLSCIGRDIGYRELQLKRNEENVWEVVRDSYEQPEVLQDNIFFLLSAFMKGRESFIGTPTELAEQLSFIGIDNVSAKALSKKLLQNKDELFKVGISFQARRSNGKRLIELTSSSVDSDDKTGTPPTPEIVVPVDPVTRKCG